MALETKTINNPGILGEFTDRIARIKGESLTIQKLMIDLSNRLGISLSHDSAECEKDEPKSGWQAETRVTLVEIEELLKISKKFLEEIYDQLAGSPKSRGAQSEHVNI